MRSIKLNGENYVISPVDGAAIKTEQSDSNIKQTDANYFYNVLLQDITDLGFRDYDGNRYTKYSYRGYQKCLSRKNKKN